jgi:predicted protein (fragment)
MKKIRCQLCEGTWIVEKEDLEKQKVCPYCGTSVQGKVEFETYDSLDKAIYGAILKMGKGVLQNIRQLSGFMLDTAPDLKKEIRIFSKTVTDDYASYIRTMFNQNIAEAEMTTRKLKQLFVEEEGLSESWADMICDGLYGALLYYKGIGCTRLINVDVNDFELSTKTTESTFTSPKQQNVENKSNLSAKPSSNQSNNTRRANTTPSNLQYTTNGDPGNLCELALKYFHGTGGCKKDERKAIKLFRESANYHNYIPAYNYLGQVFMRRREFDSSSKWYQKSAAANNIEGLCMMGYFYQKGYGVVKQNTQSALGCYASAAVTGDLGQMVDIAKKFLKGGEVPKEEKIAVDILDAAAKSGSAEAQFYLAKCYQSGTGVNVDIGKAISLYITASGNGHQGAKIELQGIQGTLFF